MAREIKVVLLGHGESIWNLGNKFTGWTDVDLSITWAMREKSKKPRSQWRGNYQAVDMK